MAQIKENNTIGTDALDHVTGGYGYYDEPVEVILEEARQTAIWWKEHGRFLENALDLLSRYYFFPGKTTRQQIDQIIIEVYNSTNVSAEC